MGHRAATVEIATATPHPFVLYMTPSLLVLTDFFQAANRALNFATNLAVPLGARLVLLHVRRDSILDPDRFTGQLSNLSKEAIGLALNSVTHDLAVPVVAEVGHGEVAQAAVDAATRHHPALIVLGRPDHSNEPDELVHTTCLDMLRLGSFPMLVVPHAVASIAPPRRVLLAVDGEPYKLGRHSDAHPQVQKTRKPELPEQHVDPAPEAAALPLLATETVQRSGLAEGLPPVQIRTGIQESPSEGLLAAARSGDFDMVAVVARPRSFLGQLFHHSVTADVLLHSPLPVLVLPAE
jgi:nucleotide-binding universal stress UspA family protein